MTQVKNTAPSATIAAGGIAQEIRAKLQVAQQNINNLKKIAAPAKVDNDQIVQDKQNIEKQQNALQKAINTDTITIKDRPIRRSREERVYDRVMISLTQYRDAPIGSLDRIVAIQRAMEGSLKQPKKHLLDAVLNFFKENKTHKGFQETTALQRIATLTPTARLQLEIWFRLFMMLATRRASKKNISLNQVRSIFKNEEFLNWLAVTMSRQ